MSPPPQAAEPSGAAGQAPPKGRVAAARSAWFVSCLSGLRPAGGAVASFVLRGPRLQIDHDLLVFAAAQQDRPPNGGTGSTPCHDVPPRTDLQIELRRPADELAVEPDLARRHNPDV